MKFLVLLVLFTDQTNAEMLFNDDLIEHYIELAAARHDVPATVLRAIAHVESRFGKDRRVRYNANGTTDIGVFQINTVHLDTTCKGLDVKHVKWNTLCAARILKIHKKKKEVDPAWYARYHSKTPSKKLIYYKKLTEAL